MLGDGYSELAVGDELVLPARDVFLSSKRPDLSFKLDFANAYLRLGYVPEGVLNLYRENIFAFNGGFEDFPRKVGVGAFERSFLDLIDSLKTNGFLPEEEPIYISSDLKAISGAHRVAASTALGLDIQVRVVDEAPSYDFDFFSRRTTMKNLDLAALVYVREFEDVRALVIHASVPDSQVNSILAAFAPTIDQIYVKKLRPNLNLYTNLKRLNYLNPMEKLRSSWAGSKANGFWGLREHALKSMGRNDVRVVFFQPRASKEIRQEIKIHVRESLGIPTHSVHSTESRLETFMLATSILHEESLLSMQNRPAGSWTKLDIASEILAGTRGLDGIPDQNLLVGGSASLDAHGIRRANDIDLVADNIEIPDHYRRLIDSKVPAGIHLSIEEGYGASAQELMHDYNSHFYFQGLKVVSLNVAHQMKKWRDLGVKDKLDALSIVHYGKLSGGIGARHSLRVALIALVFRVSTGGLRKIISIGVAVYSWVIKTLGVIRALFLKERS